jgi:hypothetical protein
MSRSGGARPSPRRKIGNRDSSLVTYPGTSVTPYPDNELNPSQYSLNLIPSISMKAVGGTEEKIRLFKGDIALTRYSGTIWSIQRRSQLRSSRVFLDQWFHRFHRPPPNFVANFRETKPGLFAGISDHDDLKSQIKLQ